MNNKIVAIIAIFALVVALAALAKPVQKIVQEIAGGSVHNTFETFDGGIGHDGNTRMTADGEFIEGGGGILTLANTVSVSYTAAYLCDYGLIRQNPISEDESDVGASVSFPVSSALIADCVPNAGDRHEVWVENTATSSGRNIEFDDGTDYELMTPGDTGVQTVITEDEIGLIRFFNLDGTSVSITFEMYLMD